MFRRNRFVVLATVAALPTPVALVAPWHMVAADPVPVASSIATHALTDAAAVPTASGLTPTEGAEARERADGEAVSVELASPPVDVPSDLAVMGVTWEGTQSKGASVQYRVQKHGEWSSWQFAVVDDDHRPDPAEEAQAQQRRGGIRAGSAPIAVTGADQVQVRVIAPTSGEPPQQAELSVIDPGQSAADASPGVAPGAATAGAPQPYIYTRKQWGANESLRDQSGPTYAEVKAAFVHHTVGTNDYTSDQVPAIIRGIYDFHVRSRGWADVGYNFFVDRFGRTWEGRYGGISRAVQGAHATGVNDDAFGVAVLGNYHPDDTPSPGTPPAATSVPVIVTRALSALVGWKAQVHGFNPAGTSVLDGVSYPGVNGHRDADGNSTECPGDTLYAEVPALRTSAGALTSGAPRYVDRWSDVDRFATAAAISRSTFPQGAGIAFVATGVDFPDALAGGPAGAVLRGPVLLTARDTLPSGTYNELQRLNPAKVVVLGGPSVVSAEVVDRLEEGRFTVERWSEENRYGTAADISRRTFPAGARTAYIATGLDFPDALAGGPAGGSSEGPVLLTARDTLPEVTAEELTRLAPERVVLIGGTGVVSTAVERQIEALTGQAPERWAGSNRNATAAEVSRQTYPDGSTLAFVATGTDFPDALAGGPAGGLSNGPLLLTGRDSIPADTVTELERLGADRIVVLGGPGAVSSSVEKQLTTYLR